MPELARKELAKVLAERTLHTKDYSLLAKEIAGYLLTQNRTADLESLLRDIMQYRADKGIIEAVALSAHELTEEIIHDVRRVLKDEYPDAKQIIVRELHDPNVVGGVRIKMANEQLDMTVKSKLNAFKRYSARERN